MKIDNYENTYEILSDKIASKWDECVFIGEIPISDFEYEKIILPELVEYLDSILKYNNLDGIDKQLYCVALVQVALRADNKFWDSMKGIYGQPLNINDECEIGDLFCRFCDESKKVIINTREKRQNVENIKMHAIIPQCSLNQFCEFMYKYYLNDINCDSNLITNEDYLTNLISVIKVNDKIKRGYLLRSPTINATKSDPEFMHELLVKMLQLINEYFFHGDNIQDINDELVDKLYVLKNVSDWLSRHFAIHRDYLKYQERARIMSTEKQYSSPTLINDRKHNMPIAKIFIPRQTIFKSNIDTVEEDITLDLKITIEGFSKRYLSKIPATDKDNPTLYVTEETMIDVDTSLFLKNIKIELWYEETLLKEFYIRNDYDEKIKYKIFLLDEKRKLLYHTNREKFRKSDKIYCISNRKADDSDSRPIDGIYYIELTPKEDPYAKCDVALLPYPKNAKLALGAEYPIISDESQRVLKGKYDGEDVEILSNFPTIEFKADKDSRAIKIYIRNTFTGELQELLFNDLKTHRYFIYEKSNRYMYTVNLKSLTQEMSSDSPFAIFKNFYKNGLYEIIVECAEKKIFQKRIILLRNLDIKFSLSPYIGVDSAVYINFRSDNSYAKINNNKTCNVDLNSSKSYKFILNIEQHDIDVSVKIPDILCKIDGFYYDIDKINSLSNGEKVKFSLMKISHIRTKHDLSFYIIGNSTKIYQDELIAGENRISSLPQFSKYDKVILDFRNDEKSVFTKPIKFNRKVSNVKFTREGDDVIIKFSSNYNLDTFVDIYKDGIQIAAKQKARNKTIRITEPETGILSLNFFVHDSEYHPVQNRNDSGNKFII